MKYVIKEFLSSLGNVFKASRVKFGGSEALDQKINECGDLAYEYGTCGTSGKEHLEEVMTSEIDAELGKETAPIRLKLEMNKKSQEHIQRRLENACDETCIEEARIKKEPERAEKLLKPQNKSESSDRMLFDLEQEEDMLKNDLAESQKVRYAQTLLDQPWVKLVIFALAAIVDIPASQQALLQLGVIKAYTFIGGVSISVLLGISGYATGVSIANKSAGLTFFWSLTGMMVLSTILILRSQAETAHALIMGLILTALWLAGTLISIRQHKVTKYKRASKRLAKVRKMMQKDDKATKVLEKKADVIEAEFKSAVDKEAKSLPEKWLQELLTLQIDEVQHLEDIRSLESTYETTRQKAKAHINARYEKGASTRYTRSSRPQPKFTH